MLDETLCDAVMIGRASMGNPFIFLQCNHYLKYNELLQPPSMDEVIKTFYQHLNGLIDQYGLSNAICMFRAIGPSYFKGIPNISKVRTILSTANDLTDIKNALLELNLKSK
jgi:tRNA-dihydrouridine synthase